MKYKFLENILLCIIVLYIVTLLLLGVRTFIPSWHNSLNGVEFGGWSMYPYYIDYETESYLINSENKKINFDSEKYIWNVKLVNSDVPNLQQETIEAFTDFLSKREEIINLTGDRKSGWRLVFKIKYRKNFGDWIKMRGISELK